jgi:membrane protease YdiL (CAAX protease family)
MQRTWIVFAVVTFAWSWAWWGKLIVEGAIVVPGSLPTHLPGLAGPAVGAFVATSFEGKPALERLWHRIIDLNFSLRGWAICLSPLLFLAAAAAVSAMFARPMPLDRIDAYPGLPRLGLPLVLLIALLANGLGEEIGWRGYALPRLQAALGVWSGTLALFPLWALWHLPLFWVVASFHSMNATMIAFGWGLGLMAGNLVLANVTHFARNSILAAALWHVLYNFSSATAIGGMAPAVSTTLVMMWAVGLIAYSVISRTSTPLVVQNVSAGSVPG